MLLHQTRQFAVEPVNAGVTLHHRPTGQKRTLDGQEGRFVNDLTRKAVDLADRRKLPDYRLDEAVDKIAWGAWHHGHLTAA
jgi:hypothetical protein